MERMVWPFLNFYCPLTSTLDSSTANRSSWAFLLQAATLNAPSCGPSLWLLPDLLILALLLPYPLHLPSLHPRPHPRLRYHLTDLFLTLAKLVLKASRGGQVMEMTEMMTGPVSVSQPIRCPSTAPVGGINWFPDASGEQQASSGMPCLLSSSSSLQTHFSPWPSHPFSILWLCP